MKYGIFHYDYPEDVAKGNLNFFNLGDYIQSLAAKQYLPHIDKTFDRDELSELSNLNDDFKLIVNGWYRLNDKRHIFNSNCLPVSVHISNTEELAYGPSLESLKRIEPIGCRDIATLKFLESRGIKSYFSSCLTTTLDKKYKYQGGARSGVIYCDVNETLFKSGKFFPLNRWLKRRQIRRTFESILKHYHNEPIKVVTHSMPLSLTHEQRFNEAEKMLELYAKAKLVITSRIHAALPCLALGTPVILVVNKYDTTRYQGLDDFLNHVWVKDGQLSLDIKQDKNGFVINDNKHIPFAEKLKNQCESWVQSFTD